MLSAHRFRSWALAAALLAASGVAGAQAAPSVVDIEYARAGEERLLLDLYLPSARGAPLLVWVHGGAWQRGSKSDMPLAALVERGYAIASVEFRQASVAQFPAQIHDIKAAIRYLRATASEHGYDASRVGVLGASSGAHLAALVAVTNDHSELEGEIGAHRAESSAVQAAVSFFGASNLTTILRQSTPFGLRIREPALKLLLGESPEEAPAVAELASPVFHVDATDPPLLLLHGDQDPQMPINQSHELEGAYRALGRDAAFIVVHGAAHGGDAFFDAERIALVAEFLDRTLRGAQPNST